jgi:hypothetical protein
MRIFLTVISRSRQMPFGQNFDVPNESAPLFELILISQALVRYHMPQTTRTRCNTFPAHLEIVFAAPSDRELISPGPASLPKHFRLMVRGS